MCVIKPSIVKVLLSNLFKGTSKDISTKKLLYFFHKNYISFTKLQNVFAVHDSSSIKILILLRPNFSHLSEHKLKLDFLDAVNPACSCVSQPETTAHLLLHCQNHKIIQSKPLNNVYHLDQTLQNNDNDHLIHTLLYGYEKLNFNLTKEKSN